MREIADRGLDGSQAVASPCNKGEQVICVADTGTKLYPVVFSLSEDGVWKISKF